MFIKYEAMEMLTDVAKPIAPHRHGSPGKLKADEKIIT